MKYLIIAIENPLKCVKLPFQPLACEWQGESLLAYIRKINYPALLIGDTVEQGELSLKIVGEAVDHELWIVIQNG